MMVASSLQLLFLALLLCPYNLTAGMVQLCDLTPHCFVICDRRDRGVDSVLYTVLHASKHGRKRRDVAFFYSFNQSIRELQFHLFGFGNTVHNGSHDAKSYFHIWLHIVDALNRTTWFCFCVLSIQISIILI